MAHAKAKLTPAGRLLIVIRVTYEGWPPAHAAAMAGVSRQTLYKWLRRFHEEGVPGLLDRSSRPRNTVRTERHPKWSLRALELRREIRRGPHLIGGRLGLAPSTVHAILFRHGLNRLSRLDRSSRAIIRYERDPPRGALLHVDVKKLGRVPDGGGWRVHGREIPGKTSAGRRAGIGFDYLHVAVDDHSRFAYVEVHKDERAETCSGFLTRAIRRFDELGVTIEAVMTDNAGTMCTLKSFRSALGGAQHLVTRPYPPQTNGKAERFNRTMSSTNGLISVADDTNAERLAALETFVEDYNWSRTHSAIGDCPPASRLPLTT